MMLKISRFTLVTFAAVFMAGCQFSYHYTDPDVSDLQGVYSATIDKSLDETWNAIIDFAGKSYFGIDTFEEDSGLLVLTFGSGRALDFVTGGYMDRKEKTLRSTISFEGDCVDYLASRNGAQLSARMTVLVREAGDRQTTVTVSTRYVYSISVPSVQSWAFNSGSYAEVAVTNLESRIGLPTMTLISTHKAECDFIEAVKAF